MYRTVYTPFEKFLIKNICVRPVLTTVIQPSITRLAYDMTSSTNPINNNKYSWTLRHSISAIDHASLDGAV